MEGTEQNQVAAGWVIITGATGSMGQVACEEMAREGRRVVMACRNVARGAEVAQRIRSAVPGAELEVRALDLESRASVLAFAQGLSGYRIDALFNNAGTMERHYSVTADGVEKTMAVNFLNLAYLSFLIIPLMGEGSRIVNMVSVSTKIAKIDLDWPSLAESDFSQLGTYAKSKLALLHFSVALANHNPHLHVNVSDPGVVNSKMISMDRWFDPLADVLFRPFISSPAKGVAPALRALHATDSLRYYVGRRSNPIPSRIASSPLCESLYLQALQLLALA